MQKSEAIDFIHQQLQAGARREEIVAELCRRTGAPADLMAKFVRQVEDDFRKARPAPAAPSPAAPAATGEAALEKQVLTWLLKGRKRDDIIADVCEAGVLNWDEAERLVSRVEQSNRKKLTTRQNLFIIPLSVIALLAGLALVMASASEMAALASQLLGQPQPAAGLLPGAAGTDYRLAVGSFVTGLGLVLGGSVGLFQVARAQMA